MTQPTTPPDDLVCATEICRILKISRRTFQRLRETGRLPPPVVQWNKTSMRWRRTDVLTLMGPPLELSMQDMAVAAAARHVTAAAASAIAAGHHAAAAANALRHLLRKPAPAELANQANAITPERNEPCP